MVKCGYEDKCVPSDTLELCFTPFKRDCSVEDPEFPYQCANDGMCRRDSTECPSPKVCPPGYFQCPNNTCLPGDALFNQCSSLADCYKTLPYPSLAE